MAYGFNIIVSGPWACFTRPEMKVERVSYDVPTPGALVGLIKGVYWKPAIEYVIDKIVVCNPIRFVNIRRNEVKDKVKVQCLKCQAIFETWFKFFLTIKKPNVILNSERR